MLRVSGLLLAGLLFVTGCGGESGPDLDDYAAAIAAAIRADDGDDDELEISADEARCVGERAAEIIGKETLEATGTPAEVEELAVDDLAAFDLSEDAVTDVAAATVACVPSTLDQFITRLDVDDAASECLAEELVADDLVPYFAVGLSGDEVGEEEEAALVELVSPCLDEPDDERAGYVAALAEFLTRTGDGLTADEADCIASDAIDIVGRERTVALGTPDEFVAATSQDLSALQLSDEELVAIGEAYLACAPSALATVRENFVDGTGLTGAAASCLADSVDEAAAAAILAISLSGEDRPTILQGLQTLVQTCA